MRNTYKHLKLWLACLFTLSATLASAQFTTLAIQDFDTIGTPALGYSLTTGTPIRYKKGLTGSTTQIPNSPYGMNNSWAWYSESEDLTVTFDNVNIAGYDTAYISFKLAALFDVDAGDYVTVSISVNGGTTWYDRVRINGNGSNCSWAYAATGVVDHLFAPVNTTTTYMPPATGVSAVGPSTILIRVPNTTNQVRVKIRQRESAAEGYYLDDLAIKVRGTTMNNAAVTGLVSPIDFCAGSHDAKVKIANKGQNRINNVTVNWTLNSNPQSPVYYFNTLDTIGGTGKNMDTITLSNLFLASGTTSTIKVWTSDPNGVPDGFHSDDTMTFTLRPALNGTYSIGGTTPDYITVAAAVADLNLLGVCGPVTFNVAPGTYTGQLNLNYIKGASAVNTVEFIGALATTTIISSLTNNGTTLTLTDSRYVTFRDLTIQNTTSSNGTAVAFVGSTNKCAVKKCVINFPNYSGSTTYGIAVTGTASGYGITNNYGDSIQIDSNTINNSYYGIYLYGNSTSPSGNFNRNHKIRNNTITAYGYGINAAYVYNALTITGNNIQFSSGASQSSYGISASSCVNSNAANAHEVSGNVIKNAGQYGIYLSTVTNPAANPGRIFNNMVGGTFRNASANAMYITESGSSPSLIYHNSLNLDYAQSLNSNATIYYSGSASTKIKNNIFAYTASGGAGVPAYIVTNLVSGNINNNVYYNAVTPTLIFKGSTGYTNANFRLATAGGDSSYNKVPTYTSASDLHVADACVRGTNLLALIGTDIDGDPRSSYPVIGADEMSAQPDNISVDAITAPQASFTAGLNDITVLVRNNGSTPLGSFAVTYVLNNGTPVTQFWNGFLNTCD
ncbi:MAG: hypothetical protein V4658_02200, partial [Bacteroidota bacterium]